MTSLFQSGARIRRTFTPQDAVDLRAQLSEWFTTPSSATAYERVMQAGYAPLDATNPRRDRLNFAQLLDASRLIWADESYTRLVSAMAAVSPSEPLTESEILYPDCFVVFSHPLPTELLGFFDSRRVRALSWHLSWGERLIFTAYDHTPRLSSINFATLADPRPVEVRVNGLFPIYTGILPLVDNALLDEWTERNESSDTAADPLDFDQLFRFVRAIGEASRSPIATAERSWERSTARGRSNPSRETALHRFYLRAPEHADEEEAAILADHGKSSPRPHWVRGHWRRQWYGTIQQHRWKWINGHPVGEYDGPTPTTPTVHIATDRIPTDTSMPSRKEETQ